MEDAWEAKWRKSEQCIEDAKSFFIRMHDIGEKNWSAVDKEKVRIMRKYVIKVGMYRYKLLKERNK